MGYSYTRRNGERVQVKVAEQFDAMAAEFKRVWGLDLLVSSGTRTRAEQQKLYNAWIAYKNGRGPKANLAAAPGHSNHEETGPTGPRALDLRDSGRDAGVTTIGTRRSNWLAANSPRWGFKNAGHYFSPKEGWHYEYTGVLTNSTSGGNAPAFSQDVANRQGFLNNMRGESLTVDGLLGDRTKEAIGRYQVFLRDNYGYKGSIDSQWGPATQASHQRYYDAAVSGRIVEDGQFGPATIVALQRALGVPTDGQTGPVTWKALQTRLKAAGHNISVDSQFGPETVKALQTYVMGAQHADGQFGKNSVLALQRYLNGGGKFEAPAGSPTKPSTAPVGRNATTRPTADIQRLVGASVDSQWGPETGAKVAAWQAKNGLEPDAVWGPLSDAKGFPNTPLPTQPTVAKRTPTYPAAKEAWVSPLTSERTAGDTISKLIVHHTAAATDQLSYFLSVNERKSAPTWYVRTNGDTIETIAPAKRPSASGAANTGSVAIETLNSSGEPTWGISDASHEAIAQIAAWLSKQTNIDGVPVAFKLDRQHLIGHRETGAATACPGPSMDLDRIVARAKVIAGTMNDDGTVKVDKGLWDQLKSITDKLFGR